jgi:hypothetical protein
LAAEAQVERAVPDGLAAAVDQRDSTPDRIILIGRGEGIVGG